MMLRLQEYQNCMKNRRSGITPNTEGTSGLSAGQTAPFKPRFQMFRFTESVGDTVHKTVQVSVRPPCSTLRGLSVLPGVGSRFLFRSHPHGSCALFHGPYYDTDQHPVKKDQIIPCFWSKRRPNQLIDVCIVIMSNALPHKLTPALNLRDSKY